jgi:hypothetical protein
MRSAKKTSPASVLSRGRRFAVVVVMGLLMGAVALPTPSLAASGPSQTIHVQHGILGGSGENPPGPE